MGLDVFEVQTGFLGRPEGAAYRFAWHLASEQDGESWEVWADGRRSFASIGSAMSSSTACSLVRGPSEKESIAASRKYGELPPMP